MELEGIYNSFDSEKRGLDRDQDIYANKVPKFSQSEATAQKHSKAFSVILVMFILNPSNFQHLVLIFNSALLCNYKFRAK